jgi:Cu/Ag efflux protein CusF
MSLLAAAATTIAAASFGFAADAASSTSPLPVGEQHTAPEWAHRAVGTVTKVARELGAVVIAHDPVPSLDWLAMTMTFAVRDGRLLDGVEAGDDVEFEFIQSGDGYVVTAIR